MFRVYTGYAPTGDAPTPPAQQGGVRYERLVGTHIYLPQPVASAHPLNRDLIGWWGHFPGLPRGGAVIDLTGRGNHGAFVGGTSTLINSHASNRPGGYGSWDFDGSDDYISIPHASRFDTGAVLTVSCWFKLDSSSDAGFLVDKMVDVFNDGWTLQHTGGTLAFYKNSSGTTLLGGTLTTGWHHVCVTVDGSGNNTLYLDGVSVHTASSSVDINSAANIKIGAHVGSFPNNTDGKVDDVRIYSRALSAEEVVALMRESRLGYPNAINWSLRLVPWVHLNAGASATATLVVGRSRSVGYPAAGVSALSSAVVVVARSASRAGRVVDVGAVSTAEAIVARATSRGGADAGASSSSSTSPVVSLAASRGYSHTGVGTITAALAVVGRASSQGYSTGAAAASSTAAAVVAGALSRGYSHVVASERVGVSAVVGRSSSAGYSTAAVSRRSSAPAVVARAASRGAFPTVSTSTSATSVVARSSSRGYSNAEASAAVGTVVASVVGRSSSWGARHVTPTVALSISTRVGWSITRGARHATAAALDLTQELEGSVLFVAKTDVRSFVAGPDFRSFTARATSSFAADALRG